jgi:hypothetical protein
VGSPSTWCWPPPPPSLLLPLPVPLLYTHSLPPYRCCGCGSRREPRPQTPRRAPLSIVPARRGAHNPPRPPTPTNPPKAGGPRPRGAARITPQGQARLLLIVDAPFAGTWVQVAPPPAAARPPESGGAVPARRSADGPRGARPRRCSPVPAAPGADSQSLGAGRWALVPKMGAASLFGGGQWCQKWEQLPYLAVGAGAKNGSSFPIWRWALIAWRGGAGAGKRPLRCGVRRQHRRAGARPAPGPRSLELFSLPRPSRPSTPLGRADRHVISAASSGPAAGLVRPAWRPAASLARAARDGRAEQAACGPEEQAWASPEAGGAFVRWWTDRPHPTPHPNP